MMEMIKGRIEKIRIIQMSNRPLVYFKVAGQNCLIAQHSLNFLADVAEGSEIVAYGSLNARNQFVCRKYAVLGKSQIVIEYEKSLYPHRKKV